MKTLTALTLATAMTFAVVAPAQANTITDTITENISEQLSDLSSNIQRQAAAALNKTVAELFFTAGIEQAQDAVTASANDTTATTTAAATDKE